MRSKHSQEEAVPDQVLGTLIINGQHCPITNMFDYEGEETLDLMEASTAVVLLPWGKWASIDVSQTGVWPLQ